MIKEIEAKNLGPPDNDELNKKQLKEQQAKELSEKAQQSKA